YRQVARTGTPRAGRIAAWYSTHLETAQERCGVAGVDLAVADQVVEVADEDGDVLAGVEGEEHLADVDHRAAIAEQRVRRRVPPQAVEQVQAKTRVQLLNHVKHLPTLRLAHPGGQSLPQGVAGAEIAHGLNRHA